MSKGKSLLLAIFTAWPFLYMLFFFSIIFLVMMPTFSGQAPSSEMPKMLMVIFPLHLLTMLDMFALLIIYIVHLFKTNRVPEDKKALWAVALFLGNLIAMPIYWYLYIWREPGQQPLEQAATHEG